MQYIRSPLTPTQRNTMKEERKVAISVVLVDQGRGRGGANSDDNIKICYLRLKRNDQGVIKRCRLSWLTNRALVNEPKCGGRGTWGVAGSQQQYSLFQFSQPASVPVFYGSVTAACYAAI